MTRLKRLPCRNQGDRHVVQLEAPVYALDTTGREAERLVLEGLGTIMKTFDNQLFHGVSPGAKNGLNHASRCGLRTFAS